MISSLVATLRLTSLRLLALRLGASRQPWRRRFAALGLVLALPVGPSRAEPPQQLPLSAQWCLERGRCIGLEVASTPRQQAMGLQLRPPLPPLRGMWFPYVPPTVARFWMHRTPEPLDMLFVSGERVIAIVAGAQPCMHLPCRSYGPDQPVDGVLELAAGQAAALGLQIGMPVRIEPLHPVRPSQSSTRRSSGSTASSSPSFSTASPRLEGPPAAPGRP